MWKFENKVIKMRPLELNRRILIWMCVYPCDENTTRWKRLAYILFSILIFVLNAIGLIFSTAYFIKYVSIDLEQSLFALLQAVGEANMVYILIITFILRHKITAMLKSLSKIYDMCKEDAHFFFFWTKITSQKLTSILKSFFVNWIIFSLRCRCNSWNVIIFNWSQWIQQLDVVDVPQIRNCLWNFDWIYSRRCISICRRRRLLKGLSGIQSYVSAVPLTVPSFKLQNKLSNWISVFRGIKIRCSDTPRRLLWAWRVPNVIWLPVRWFFFLYRCANIIVHFIKCFCCHFESSINAIQIEMTSNFSAS